MLLHFARMGLYLLGKPFGIWAGEQNWCHPPSRLCSGLAFSLSLLGLKHNGNWGLANMAHARAHCDPYSCNHSTCSWLRKPPRFDSTHSTFWRTGTSCNCTLECAASFPRCSESSSGFFRCSPSVQWAELPQLLA